MPFSRSISCTPLHYAAGAGNLELCKLLVERGAKPTTWDFNQYTAVDYAKQSGAADCATYLKEASAPGAWAAGTHASYHELRTYPPYITLGRETAHALNDGSQHVRTQLQAGIHLPPAVGGG